MKKFIIKSLIFVLIIISILAGLEIVARKMYQQKFYVLEKEFDFKINNFNKRVNSVEILFLGSSHTVQGVNPDIIDENTFNLAFLGQDFYYDYMLLKKYYHKLKSLKLVCIELDPRDTVFDMLTNSRGATIKYFRKCKIPPRESKGILLFLQSHSMFFNIRNRFFSDFIKYIAKKKKKLMIKPKMVANESIKQMTTSHGILKANGYRATKSGTNYNKLTKSIIKSKGHPINNFDSTGNNYKINKKILFEFFHYANENNIKLLVYSTPRNKVAQKAISALILENYEKLINDIKKKFPNIMIKNYSTLGNINISDFWNLDHMNEHGAEKFSKMLNKDINKILKDHK